MKNTNSLFVVTISAVSPEQELSSSDVARLLEQIKGQDAQYTALCVSGEWTMSELTFLAQSFLSFRADALVVHGEKSVLIAKRRFVCERVAPLLQHPIGKLLDFIVEALVIMRECRVTAIQYRSIDCNQSTTEPEAPYTIPASHAPAVPNMDSGFRLIP